MLAVLRLVEILSKLVYSVDSEHSSEGIDDAAWLNFIACQVIISNEVLTWLIYCKTLGQFLPSKEKREWVSSVVGMMHFSYLHSVICQIVVNDIR